MLFLYAFVAQVVVCGLVVVALKFILDDMLIDLALRQLEYTLNLSNGASIKKIHVVSHRNLKISYRDRIVKATRKCGVEDSRVSCTVDRAIKGGAIIRVDDKSFDCSLRDRLRQAFSRR